MKNTNLSFKQMRNIVDMYLNNEFNDVETFVLIQRSDLHYVLLVKFLKEVKTYKADVDGNFIDNLFSIIDIIKNLRTNKFILVDQNNGE